MAHRLYPIPIKTRLKMMTARAIRLWLLPLEALLRMLTNSKES